jgi:hypothetical protein
MAVIVRRSRDNDRGAKDRRRHLEKIRHAIRENIADIIAEESIIGKDGSRTIRVPIRGIKEYQFIYGSNNPQVGQGHGNSNIGDVVKKGGQKGQGQKAGNEPGEEIYETEITVDELIDIIFEDLSFPDMERNKLRYSLTSPSNKIKGKRRKGVNPRLDKKKTFEMRIKRWQAARRMRGEENNSNEEDFPFHEEDLRYRHSTPFPREESCAVVICIMDVSGSMNTMKKYLARSFYFLLYRFVRTKYETTDVVFIVHDMQAKEVSEDEFFHRGESGGTCISAGYQKALEIIKERYDPSLWNIYVFHCSDGENFDDDNEEAVRLAKSLCEVSNLFGYGEIKPETEENWGSISDLFEKEIKNDNFSIVRIRKKEDVYPMFKCLLGKEKRREQWPT